MEGSQGQLGNLHQMTKPQLQELLDRQEKLLAKRKFLESLPDKGEKVKKFASTLRQLIAERTNCDSSSQHSVSTRTVSGSVNPASSTKNIVSDFTRLRDRAVPDGGSNVEKGDQPSVLEELSQPRGRLPEVVAAEPVWAEGVDQGGADALSERLQGMMVHDAEDRNGAAEDRSGARDDSVHPKAGGEILLPNSYEVVMRSNAENADKRAPFKPNSTLKVTSVKDLPPEVSKDKKPVANSETATVSRPKVLEESAVHPPEYHFQKVKMISVEDSIELERRQRQELERIQAEHAAERLAERLHIRMDEFNVPVTNMEYRTHTDDYADRGEADSDDDPEPADNDY